MAKSVVVINVVGLTQSLIGEHTPHLSAFLNKHGAATIRPVMPAVTCSVQSSMLTGLPVSGHGSVGNGWYNHEQNEVQFWKQSNQIVQGEKIWETAKKRDNTFTCLNMFWWYNMYSSADYSVTPRPIYKADGRKIPDCYSHPQNLRDELQEKLGTFPLFRFWGPATSIASTQWIADATKIMHAKTNPTLTLCYLPHLDYILQKVGPDITNGDVIKDLTEIDTVVGDLLDYFASKDVVPIIVSEYGIDSVGHAVALNRYLRDGGGVSIREEEGLELLDCGASDAFAVCDHQTAHVYIKDHHRIVYFRDLLKRIDGVEHVYDKIEQAALGINHARSGELFVVANKGCWFSYYYWQTDTKAPDFARCVDIHRKPGYDPCELFMDPKISAVKFKLAMKLVKKKLGYRTLMDVIPLDHQLVKGSHGRVDLTSEHQPILMTSDPNSSLATLINCTDVYHIVLKAMEINA